MNATREQIATALFNLVKTATGVQNASRRWKIWSDVAPADQPALFLVQGKEMPHTTVNGQPPRWLLRFEVVLYVNVGEGNDADITPDAVINPLVDAVEAALKPPRPGENQTLQGLVIHCRIDGQIEGDGGVLGPQAVRVIPVEVLAT